MARFYLLIKTVVFLVTILLNRIRRLFRNIRCLYNTFWLFMFWYSLLSNRIWYLNKSFFLFNRRGDCFVLIRRMISISMMFLIKISTVTITILIAITRSFIARAIMT